MREIKFRGKRVDDGEWVVGSFIPDALEGSNSDLVSWGFIRRYNRDVGKMETIEVDRETVGQYIGLKDKNGKEIYEGDVVLTDEAGWIGHVIYGCDCFMVIDGNGGFSSCCNWEAFEVIGNIHDKEEQP